MTLFHSLVTFYNAQPDKRGEVHVTCPWCGKQPQRGQVHFSFSEEGCHCFVCGKGGSLEQLAKTINLYHPDPYCRSGNDIFPERFPSPKRFSSFSPSHSWIKHTEKIAKQYADHPDVVQLWQAYRPLSEETIRANRLGVGVLPASRCKHPRLIIPLIDFSGNVVGFRGRSYTCDCERWLSPAGNKTSLYNWQALGKQNIVFVVENAADALLLTEKTDAVAVATLSISYWSDEWTRAIIESDPEKVVLAFDNHYPAMGTYRAEWEAAHSNSIIQIPASRKRWNDLAEISTRLIEYPWGDEPEGKDIGDVLTNEEDLQRLRSFIASLRRPPVFPSVDIPEPPEFAYERQLLHCPPPPRQSLARLSLNNARELIDTEIRAYLDERSPEHILLVRASPGVGKTTIAVNICHDLAERGRRVMYAAPRHNFFHDIIAASHRNDRDLSQWYEWLPRNSENPQMCQHNEAISRWMHKGYCAIDFCIGICGHIYMETNCPYHQQKKRREPIIMTQHQHVTVGHPLQFDVMIGDESPLGAFCGVRTIPAEHIIPKQMSRDNPMMALLHYLLPIVVGDKVISGPDLFSSDRLGDATNVAQLCADFAMPLTAQPAVLPPSTVGEANNADYFYLHQLASLLQREANLAAAGSTYPPRVLAGRGSLRLLMRKPVNDHIPRHVVWLDATGNQRIYETLFGRRVQVVNATPDVLGTVFQICDRANGKGSLVQAQKQTAADGKRTTTYVPTEKTHQTIQLVDRIVDDMGYGNPGVITFKAIEKMFAGKKTCHFYAARGTNDLLDCDAIFIVGTPMPSREELLFSGAWLFFERDIPFNTIWRDIVKHYMYTAPDGSGCAYCVGGYWGDADMEALLSVYRDDEIVQAAHRVRPVLRPVDIWLLTNIPLDELPPDNLMSMAAVLQAPPGVNIWNWSKLITETKHLKYLDVSTIMEILDVSYPTALRYFNLLIQYGIRREYDPGKDGPISVKRGGHNKRILV